MAKQPTSTDKLMASIDANRKASAITPKAKPNAPKSGKGFALDVDGSTCLSDARWSPNGGGTLAVTFVKDGSQYLYFGVERSVAKQVDSGEDFNDLIKGSYSYE
jgi:hypothetical protein